jgi:hypothetical protein
MITHRGHVEESDLGEDLATMAVNTASSATFEVFMAMTYTTDTEPARHGQRHLAGEHRARAMDDGKPPTLSPCLSCLCLSNLYPRSVHDEQAHGILGKLERRPPLGVVRVLSYDVPVMRFRWVTLLTAICLTLDFANPMMGGAVCFVDGSLEADAGCHARGVEDPAPAGTPTQCHFSTVMPPREPSRPAVRVISASPPVPVFFRSPVEPRSTATSSPDDD